MNTFMRSVLVAAFALSALAQERPGLTPEELRQLNARLRLQPRSDAVRPLNEHEQCVNGDFETKLDSTQWSGATGFVLTNGDPYFNAFETVEGRQTLVSAGDLDPIVGIRTVAPGRSTRALRVGNSSTGAQAESLWKRFVVREPIIRFQYAVVFQDPMHDDEHPRKEDYEQPSFWVRVLDSSGHVIPGAVTLANGKDKYVAGTDNPRFIHKTNTLVHYRDWSCAQIDLSKHVGEIVTVEFITEDCTLLGHFAYAYVDDFCGDCGFDFAALVPPPCGPELCFAYSIPAGAAVRIDLAILRDGKPIASKSSGALTGGTSYCFDTASMRPFDYIATASAVGGPPVTHSIGAAPDGVRPGRNNDYGDCGTPGCCEGANLIVNGDFEAADHEFDSDYLLATPPAVPPGSYAVLDAAQAASVAGTWETCGAKGKFLAVNGSTGGRSRTLWSGTAAVVPGAEYRFCAKARNLPQCAFDVKPRIEMRFSSGPDTAAPSVIDVRTGEPCWDLESRVIRIPSAVTTLRCEIWLHEDTPGDGNDLAIDDVSLQELFPAEAKYVEVAVARSDSTVTAVPTHGQPYAFAWEFCEVDGRDECIPGSRVTAPPPWSSDPRKSYRVRYSVSDDCILPTTSTWFIRGSP